MMHMTFYWGKTVTILFDSWKTQTWNSYILSLLACFLISVLYQFAEDRRLKLKLLSSIPNSSSAEAPLIGGARWKARTKWSPLRFLGAVFFCANSAIGYLLMLAIMSFNAGVFLAVVLGLGVGYLLFRDDGDVVVVDNPCACA